MESKSSYGEKKSHLSITLVNFLFLGQIRLEEGHATLRTLYEEKKRRENEGFFGYLATAFDLY